MPGNNPLTPRGSLCADLGRELFQLIAALGHDWALGTGDIERFEENSRQ